MMVRFFSFLVLLFLVCVFTAAYCLGVMDGRKIGAASSAIGDMEQIVSSIRSERESGSQLSSIARATYYAEPFHGRLTASGVPYDMNDLTAAHPFLPFGTKVRVTNLSDGRFISVWINDRGPYTCEDQPSPGQCDDWIPVCNAIDLSKAAFYRLCGDNCDRPLWVRLDIHSWGS